MARIRTIKPEFFTDSKVTRLTPLARLFYVSLWCEADKQGRLKWDPESLKYRYLPADKAKVEDVGAELLQAKMIRLYESEGQIYADIPGFLKHQIINNRESESSLPPFSSDACLTRESGVPDAAYGKEGREGKGRKEPPIVPKGDVYPEKFLDLMKVYPSRGDARNPLPPAYAAWKKALERGGVEDQIIEAAKIYARTEAAGTKFIAQTATWLNQDDWKQAPPAPPQRIVNAEDSQWRLRCTGYAPGKFWNKDQWGPRPGEPGCLVPEHIIKETNADGMDPAFLKRAG